MPMATGLEKEVVESGHSWALPWPPRASSQHTEDLRLCQAGLPFSHPRVPWPGTAHSEPSLSCGLWAPRLPSISFRRGQRPAARASWSLHATSLFLYKLSTCHPAVCFSLLRFSSNYVDFLHPTPSWKLIRLNIFIYYHFAQLLPAFPITLPASL